MESEKEYENLVNIICRKMAHIIVESRLGRRIQTPCKVHADGADWFNLTTEDMPEVVKEVKRLLAVAGDLTEPGGAPLSFCVEISVRTADGVSLVLEQWCLTLDPSAATGGRPSNNVINQIGVLLKSLVVSTRLTTAYRLSRQQSQESHIILYKIYIGAPDLATLGDSREQMVLGEVATPVCSVSLALHFRTRLAISSRPADAILIKSDHFKPEQSPRVRHVTAFVERRHSDCVDMIGISSSSSSNMDTKTTGGSSTDSDQRRRVAAFVDDSGERPPPLAQVPFTRLMGEPAPLLTSPPAAAPAAAADVSMSDSRRTSSEAARPPAASADPAADDFVMVELRTPFCESDSDSELGAFFRTWQTAPSLVAFSSGPERPQSTSPAGSSSPAAAAAAADPQLLSLSQQLHNFQLKSREFDEMIQQLSETEPEAK